jgi:hypothetical protein
MEVGELMTDIDDKLLEQQEQEQKKREMDPKFEAGGNGHGYEKSETPIADEELKQYQEQEQSEEKECQGKKEEYDGNGKIQSAADILVHLATENTKLLFKDQYGTAHAQVHIADHDEIIKAESSKFKRYLSRLFYDKNDKKVVNAESITNAIQVLQAKAEYDGPTIPLSLRVAWQDDDIDYDLSNDRWQCIKVSQQGWEILNSTPSPVLVRFNQTPQADPERN